MDLFRGGGGGGGRGMVTREVSGEAERCEFAAYFIYSFFITGKCFCLFYIYIYSIYICMCMCVCVCKTVVCMCVCVCVCVCVCGRGGGGGAVLHANTVGSTAVTERCKFVTYYNAYTDFLHHG